MSRAVNIFRHNAYKTLAKRQAASDDVLVDTPDAVIALAVVPTGATTANVTWTNPTTNAGESARIDRAADSATPGDNGVGSAVAVTFTDVGDLVGLVAHGFAANQRVVFNTVVTTTGVSVNTVYFVVNPTADAFQVAATVAGSALALTTNGTGTVYVPEVVLEDTGDLVRKVAHGYVADTRVMFDSIIDTTGIVAGTSYYVQAPTANTFQLSATPGGVVLPLTTNGLGVQYLPVFTHAEIANVAADDESYSDTGLTTLTEYDYRVSVFRKTSQLATAPTAHGKTS